MEGHASAAATRMKQEGIEGTGRSRPARCGRRRAGSEADYLRLPVAADGVRAASRVTPPTAIPYTDRAGLRPGAGAIVAAVEAASGVTPVSIGKAAP